jgi:hypothetical protein
MHANPFAQMLDPSALMQACAASADLKALDSCIHRPLDKLRLGFAGADLEMEDDEGTIDVSGVSTDGDLAGYAEDLVRGFAFD